MGVKQNNWMKSDFDDSAWKAADTSRGTNKSPKQFNWGTRPNIAGNANWIWPTGYPSSTTNAYCRKTVGFGGKSDWSYCSTSGPCTLGLLPLDPPPLTPRQ